MANVKLPHFGMLDASSVEEYYDAAVNYNNTEIQIDLNFESTSVDIQKLETVKHFIDNIRIHDLSNRKHIEKDFDDDGSDTVKFYIENHLEVLAEDTIASLIGSHTRIAEQPRLLLKKLHLIRVGLYPNKADQFATFDYSISSEITDQLVVVFTDENGNLDYMTTES